MNLKLANLSAFFAKILEHYHELRQELQRQRAYKVVGKEFDEEGKLVVTVQLTGKSVTFQARAEKILADDTLVESFSSKDIRTMTYLACEKKFNKPKNKIALQQFSSELNRLVFQIKNPNGKNIEYKTAAEISADKKLLDSLESRDAHIIGYTTAAELDAMQASSQN